MIPTGNIYSATIPASHVTTAGVEYYIEAVDDASNTAYSPAIAPEKPYSITVKINVGYAIIIAGRMDDGCAELAINISANNTYEVLLNRCFTKERIFYLHPSKGQGVDNISSIKKIDDAITWAQNNVSVNVPLFIYLVGHCENDTFIINGTNNDTLTATALNNSLNRLSNETECEDITVICEGPDSGNFIDDLSNDRKVIISSTGVTLCSKYHKEMGGVFSHCFFDNISSGKSIKAAFENASNSSVIKHYSTTICKNKGHLPQTPWLDDNGDGKGVRYHLMALGMVTGLRINTSVHKGMVIHITFVFQR